MWCYTKEGNISKLQPAQNYASRIVAENFDYANFKIADLLYKLNEHQSKKDAIILHQ